MAKCYSAVIFDLGKVLFQCNPYEVAQNLQAQDPSINLNIYKITHTPFWHLFDLGHLSIKDMVEYFSKDFSSSSLELFFAEFQRRLTPIEFGVNLLKCMQDKNIPTYLLSNLSRDFHAWLLPRHSFLQNFNGTVYSFEVQLAKPDPKIYLHLLEKYNLCPEKCLFLDDLESNIYAARRLGIDGILFEDQEQVLNELKRLALI